MSQGHDHPTASPPSEAGAPADTGHRPLRFVHGGRVVEVDGVAPTTSVLTWLRELQHCTGTKEGCNEGDCGACTVLVGELDAGGRAVQWKPVNACIQFLPTLDGKALLTVEDLGGTHPAQRALVECHGSQCGFCTPGFVMSLAGCAQRHAEAGTVPTRQQIADDLSGNLCRCTGYRPILDAGERMAALPAQPLADVALPATLAALRGSAPLTYRANDASGAVQAFHAPRTLDALAALLAAKPQARLLAGSTDIGLWVNKQFRDLGEVVFLGEVDALKTIAETDGELTIGAGASLEAAWTALVARWPALREMHLRFASRPVREAGTMGGNVANGSPIGDSAPVLLALGASLTLRRGADVRRVPLDAFYLGYLKNALQPGEFVQAIHVPLPGAGEVLRAYKLSKRRDCDISALACGLWLRRDGERIAAARLAFGGMAATVARAAGAEAALVGQPWTEATLAAATAALAADFQPLTDLRASAGYRRRAAAALLRRFWLETRPGAPLAPELTSVWSAA